MVKQMKIKMLEKRLKETDDLIIKGALNKRIKQLKLQNRVDLLCKIHI